MTALAPNDLAAAGVASVPAADAACMISSR